MIICVTTEKCVTVAAEKHVCKSGGETDTGSAVAMRPFAAERRSMYGRYPVLRYFPTLHSAERVASLITRTPEPRGRKWLRKVQSGFKRPFPLLCVYLTTKIPSIRDKTTVVEAIIPDLTLIKVIIVFLICNAKSAKPDQYINTIKLDRCGPIYPQTRKHMRGSLSCGACGTSTICHLTLY